MKITAQITIDCDSYFEEKREPKTTEDWAEFLSNHFITDSNIIGEAIEDESGSDYAFADMISINSFEIEVTNF